MIAVSLLRAVNVGGRQVRKEEIIAAHSAAGCLSPQTLLASGNVVFKTSVGKLDGLAQRIEEEFERTAGFRAEAILRSHTELRDIANRNPFAHRKDIDGSKLLVTFLATAPRAASIRAASAIDVGPEEMLCSEAELFIYFPNGMGRSKFPSAAVAKALGGMPGTGRNWNTVMKLLALCDSLEAKA